MEFFIQAFDYVLIGVAIWAIFSVRGLGGLIGKAFNYIMIAMVFLGIAHIFETISVEILQWDIGPVELVHRVIVLAGFVFLALGFSQLPRIKKALA